MYGKQKEKQSGDEKEREVVAKCTYKNVRERLTNFTTIYQLLTRRDAIKGQESEFQAREYLQNFTKLSTECTRVSLESYSKNAAAERGPG